ncbi:hypothetical protein M885DRAFT_611721 [Pelagophyceae sp. CCMP2097]|nr:hypothetical protein M885DRAFT_611721 [Pelagophyceae sp. CCMP2097]|mmetsp:Transcript_18031/g.64113  ORF Transcript_18031/g.64113 Transcript_18031/m.64113 type:complete len:180 (+) Transcript_18031:98-637(+)
MGDLRAAPLAVAPAVSRRGRWAAAGVFFTATALCSALLYARRPARFAGAKTASPWAFGHGTEGAGDASDGGMQPFRVCGHYCGPGWCDNDWVDEGECTESRPVERGLLGGPSCADSCCKAHDRCCGGGDESQCNSEILACLDECDGADPSCTRHGVPVSPNVIGAVMGLVEDWCCGHPC